MSNKIIDEEVLLDEMDKYPGIRCGETAVGLLKRLFSDDADESSEGTSYVSCFDSREDAAQLIAGALNTPENAAKISLWLEGNYLVLSRDRKHILNEMMIRESLDEPEVLSGRGFDSHMRERFPGGVTIIIEKDRKADQGFHVKRAFPDIRHPESRFSGRVYDGRELANNITDWSPLRKIEVVFRNNIIDAGVHYREENGRIPDRINVSVISNPYTVKKIYLYADGKISAKCAKPGQGYVPLSEEDLKFSYPAEFRLVEQMRSTLGAMTGGKKLYVPRPFEDQAIVFFTP